MSGRGIKMKKTDNDKIGNDKKEGKSSVLLERYLQKNMTDRMQQVDDEALAKAIKTLLYADEKKNKRLN